MRRILSSTAFLSGASFLGILTGLITGKLSALWLGPRGVGALGEISSTIGLGGFVLGLGVSMSVTRVGSNFLAAEDEKSFTALVWAARSSVAAMIAIGIAVTILWGQSISQDLYGSSGYRVFILPFLLVSVLGNSFAGIESGILRARLKYIKALSGASVIYVLVTFALSVAGLATRHTGAMLPVYAGSALANAVILASLVKKHQLVRLRRPPITQIIRGARTMYGFGLPFTTSMLVGNGVRMVIPVLVLHWAGDRNLGFYMAAITISSQYLGFLSNSMLQDYAPQLSSENDPVNLEKLIMDELTVVLLITTPLICLVMMLSPVVIPLVYTSKFTPAVPIIQWMVAADLFRFGLWPISYAILSKMPGKYYLSLESLGGALALVVSWLGFRLGGLTGLGWAYVIIFPLLAAATLAIGLRVLPLSWSSFPWKTIAASFLAITGMRVLSLWGLNPFPTIIMSLIALASSLWSYKHLAQGWQMHAPANLTLQE